MRKRQGLKIKKQKNVSTGFGGGSTSRFPSREKKKGWEKKETGRERTTRVDTLA